MSVKNRNRKSVSWGSTSQKEACASWLCMNLKTSLTWSNRFATPNLYKKVAKSDQHIKKITHALYNDTTWITDAKNKLSKNIVGTTETARHTPQKKKPKNQKKNHRNYVRITIGIT